MYVCHTWITRALMSNVFLGAELLSLSCRIKAGRYKVPCCRMHSAVDKWEARAPAMAGNAAGVGICGLRGHSLARGWWLPLALPGKMPWAAR